MEKTHRQPMFLKEQRALLLLLLLLLLLANNFVLASFTSYGLEKKIELRDKVCKNLNQQCSPNYYEMVEEI
jgi:hypothetical protein